MFERWTRNAKEVLKSADTIARRFGVEYIDTTHLLLAFLEITKDMEVWKLFWEEFDVDPNRFHHIMENQPRKKTRCSKKKNLGLTPMVKRITEGVTPDTTTHVTLNDLFLKILGEKNCCVTILFNQLGINQGGAKLILRKIN